MNNHSSTQLFNNQIQKENKKDRPPARGSQQTFNRQISWTDNSHAGHHILSPFVLVHPVFSIVLTHDTSGGVSRF